MNKDQAELLRRLDAACPGFVAGDGDAELAYIWMSGFVRHVTRAWLAGRHLEVQAVFEVVEAVIAADNEASELAVVGFLEDMQNGNLHPEGSRPQNYRLYLGPQALKAWEGLNGFWQAVSAGKQQR